MNKLFLAIITVCWVVNSYNMEEQPLLYDSLSCRSVDISVEESATPARPAEYQFIFNGREINVPILASVLEKREVQQGIRIVHWRNRQTEANRQCLINLMEEEYAGLSAQDNSLPRYTSQPEPELRNNGVFHVLEKTIKQRKLLSTITTVISMNVALEGDRIKAADPITISQLLRRPFVLPREIPITLQFSANESTTQQFVCASIENQIANATDTYNVEYDGRTISIPFNPRLIASHVLPDGTRHDEYCYGDQMEMNQRFLMRLMKETYNDTREENPSWPEFEAGQMTRYIWDSFRQEIEQTIKHRTRFGAQKITIDVKAQVTDGKILSIAPIRINRSLI